MSDEPVDPSRRAELLIRDTLTGAYSRALFESRLDEEIGRARRNGTNCILCLFDIDHFKSVNDAYGHQRGDQVLRELTLCVQGVIRFPDLLFRYGGDEFVLLLPETHKANAFALCKRLFDKVRGMIFEGDPPLTLSISMGVAAFPADASDGRHLLEAADRRTYIAKRQGRDRFVVGDAPTQPRLHFDSQDRLIEREQALETLQTFFQEMSGKPSGLLVVSGPRDTGRTRFLEQVLQTAQMHQYAVLSLRGSRAVLHRPYGALMAARWSVPLLVAGGVVAIDSALKQGLAQQDKTRLLISVDDLQMVDRATRELLRQLLAVSEIPGLVVAYTVLPGSVRLSIPSPQALTTEVSLSPFSKDGLKVWLRQLFKSEPSPAFFRWLYQQTQGYPGRVQSVLMALMAQGLLQPREAGEWDFNSGFVTYSYTPEVEQATPANNLPISLTDFVGRDQLSWELDQLLTTRRLVTLIGPGGIGKTRLALELAIARQDLYIDGVWFVSLEAIRVPEKMILAIAQVFGLRPTEGQSLLESLKAFLHDKTLLLVLDNFEQVLEAASLVAEILVSAPQVQMVITSRELLHVSGEQVFNVPPLNTPDLQHLPDIMALERIEAVALFVDRARQVKYNFTLTETNAPIVAEICTRLDGLPLAIELAAARINQFSLRKLADQLHHRLMVLVDGPSNLTTRQRTMRDAIHWSYGLLSPTEQGLFARLGVFLGGCNLSSAEKVCSEDEGRGQATGNGISQLAITSIQPSLTALVNKSLLHLREGKNGEIRYTMLEAIHEYAVEQLELSGEAELLRQRHAYHYLELVEEAEPYLTGPDQIHWLDRLEGDHDNLQAALDWFWRQSEVEAALRFAAAAWKFWQIRSNYHAEGQQWLERVLALGGSEAKRIALATRAKVLWGAGRLAEDLSDSSPTEELFTESLAISMEIGDERGIARAQHALATIVERQPSELARAEALYLECLERFRNIDDMEDVGWTLLRLGTFYYHLGKYSQSMDHFEQSRVVFGQIGQTRAMAVAILQLVNSLMMEGKYERISLLLDEGLAQIEELGDILNITRLRFCHARVAFQQGEYLQAGSILEESLRTARSIGDEFTIEKAQTLLGALSLALEDAQQARPLLEEALPNARRLSDHQNVFWTLVLLGYVALALGEANQAAQFYRESLELYRSYLLIDNIAESLEGFALLAVTRAQAADARRAARLLGAADMFRHENTFPRTAFMQTVYERICAALRLQLDEKANMVADAEGKAMTIQQAISYAIENPDGS